MKNTFEEELKKAVYRRHINYIEYYKLTSRVVKFGSGDFRSVFKYERKDCELTVGLKCLKVNAISDSKVIKDCIDELKLFRNFEYHQNINLFYGVTKDYNGYYYMVFQYANEGNLRKYLKENFMMLQWSNKIRIATEIALGLSFLHDNDIVHMNLHSKNILIHQGKPKITDFTPSKSIVCRMAAYADPQYFTKRNYVCGKKSDVYSFGVILWEISSGVPPFQYFTSERPLIIHTSRGNREDPIEGSPLQYVKLYKQCWDENPETRPEARTIFETLNKLIPNEILNKHLHNENTFLNQQENRKISKRHNSQKMHGITASSSVSRNTHANKRNEARKFINEGRFLKALNIYEEIYRYSGSTKNCQENWTISRICSQREINELVEVLSKNRILTSLDIRHNNIGRNGGKLLAKVLCANTVLTTLNLQNNKIKAEGAIALAEALSRNKTLTYLNICGGRIGPEGAKAIADALWRNTTLTFLDISNNVIGSRGCIEIAEALYINSTLTTLNLCNNHICSKAGFALAKALFRNITLISLNLEENLLGPKGGEALANALRKNFVLKSLNLSYNKLGPRGGAALAKALRKNSLTSLDLKQNELGFEGGKALARTLYEGTSLIYLNLCDNKLESEEVKILASALFKNATLVSLNLGFNKIGTEGGEAIAAALCKNTTVTSLNLQNGKLGVGGGKALIKALSKNTTLISLDIRKNEFDFVIEEGFKRLVNDSRQILYDSNNYLRVRHGNLNAFSSFSRYTNST